MNWLPFPQHVPEVGEDYLAFTQSIRVLMTDGKTIELGYLQIWTDEEDNYPNRWKLDGRDGYDFEGEVTHWMSLPELP